MHITILGSGSCIPTVERNAAGFLLEVADFHILVDCGSGTVRQLARAGLDYRQIDMVCLSHVHPDHAGDLAGLVQALKVTPERNKELIVGGDRRIGAFYRQVVTEMVGTVGNFPVRVVDLEKGFQGPGFSLETIRVPHGIAALALRVATARGTVVFTGDSAWSEELVAFCRNADLVVADCSTADEPALPGHMTAGECGRLASEAGVGRLVLSHFYPATDPAACEAACRRFYTGPLIVAEDFLRLSL